MDEEKSRSCRSNDIWISAGMVAVIMTTCVGGFTIYNALSNGAIAQESRFTRLEEQLKSLQNDLQELRQAIKQ